MSTEFQNILQSIGYIQNIVAALIGTGAAIIYNVLKHKHDRDLFKRDLFVSLNARYEQIQDGMDKLVVFENNVAIDHLNRPNETQPLRHIIDRWMYEEIGEVPQILIPIYNYITLCSEQYYWFNKGLIDDNVWVCWKEAMAQWYEYSDFFKELVLKEREKKVKYYNADFLSIFPS